MAFASSSTNLVADDTNGYTDVFVRDLTNNTTTRVSVGSDGQEGTDYSDSPSISGDGNRVAFRSGVAFVPEDTGNGYQIYVRDRATNQTVLVSKSSSGQPGNDTSDDPYISADGRYVAFHSSASNLVPGDANGVNDVFVHEL